MMADWICYISDFSMECRKVDGETFSFLAFTDEDCSNWTDHLTRLVSVVPEKTAIKETLEPGQGMKLEKRPKALSDGETGTEIDKSTSEWYSVKEVVGETAVDGSTLQTKSESFASKKVKSKKGKAVRNKVRPKTGKSVDVYSVDRYVGSACNGIVVRPKRAVKAREGSRSLELRKPRIAASRKGLSEPRMVAQRACGMSLDRISKVNLILEASRLHRVACSSTVKG